LTTVTEKLLTKVQCLHTKAPCTPTGRVLPSFQQKAIVFVAQQKTLQGTTLCTIEVGSHSPELCKDNTSGIAKKNNTSGTNSI
jgi:hypothetical protein